MKEQNSICWNEAYVVDEMNSFYDNYVVGHEPNAHFTVCTELLNLCEKGGKLLDIGTGTAAIVPFCKDFEFYGSDLPHVLAGCAMRNFPHQFYRACNLEEDNLAWMSSFDVILANGVFDIMEEGLYILRRVLTHARNYLIIHRQEITEDGETHSILNGSYGGKTYHSIINRNDFYTLLDEMGFEIIEEKQLTFSNWENGGCSFLLRKIDREDKKYESHPLRQMRNRIQATSPRKVVIGSGDVPVSLDWICTNEEEIDAENRDDWQFMFGDTRADNILSEHIFEHLRAPGKAAKNIFEFLKPGGLARIAVPDGYHPDPEYIKQVEPGGIGAGSSDHVHLWNIHSLSALFKAVGFEVTPVEWFDENGEFHKKKWDVKDGMIRRSLEHDERNVDGKPNYSSLILDLRKP